MKEEIESKAHELATTIGTASIVITILCAVVLSFYLLSKLLSMKRGSSTATRFVRDTVGYHSTTLWMLICLACFFIETCVGLVLINKFWAGLPWLIPAVIAYIIKFQSTVSKQRVTDARNVATAATNVALNSNNPVSRAVKNTVQTASIEAKSQPVVDAVVIEDSTNVQQIEAKPQPSMKAIAMDTSDESFRAFASRAGINIDDKTDDQIASEVIRNAPQSMLAALPNDLSNKEKALRIMNGVVS
jgi:hypothetical protein